MPPPPSVSTRDDLIRPLLIGGLTLAIILFIGPLRPHAIDRYFAQRGGTPSDVSILVTQVGADAPTGPFNTIAPDTELAFSYRNQSNREYLMIFGVDEREGFHWYYPQRSDPSFDPPSVPIKETPTMKALPHLGPSHYDALQLHLFALFLKTRRSAHAVEQSFAESPDERPHFDDQLMWETTLRVKPR